MNTISLGNAARDKITGFSGTITGRSEYLYGCTQYCLVPAVGADGQIREGQWFDEGRIEITGHGINPEDVRGEANGGPNRDAPGRRR